MNRKILQGEGSTTEHYIAGVPLQYPISPSTLDEPVVLPDDYPTTTTAK